MEDFSILFGTILTFPAKSGNPQRSIIWLSRTCGGKPPISDSFLKKYSSESLEGGEGEKDGEGRQVISPPAPASPLSSPSPRLSLIWEPSTIV